MSGIDWEVHTEDKKYSVFFGKDGSFYATRYGEFWRDLCGDNLVYALCQKILEQQRDLDSHY